jgi:multidrug transporter EmrE-like cation transporter
MSMPVLILIASQVLYTTGDFMGRVYMSRHGFCAAAFLSWWFAVYFILRTIAMFGQLYVFTTVPLGKTMALFGAVSILLSNALGLLLLKEVLSPMAYAGVTLAIVAFVIMAFR